MRRKIAIGVMAIVSALMSQAKDDGYGALVFTYVTGETYAVETQGLEIYFKDGVLTFSNDGRSIPVASLASMEFSDDTGVEGILTDSAGPVSVFSVDGVKAGEYRTLSEACGKLAPGLYVVRKSNGETFKIRVGQ